MNGGVGVLNLDYLVQWDTAIHINYIYTLMTVRKSYYLPRFLIPNYIFTLSWWYKRSF
jgi:hypothetical protein